MIACDPLINTRGTYLSASQSYQEKELLLRIAEGDEQAFADLYAGFAPRLQAYTVKFTHSATDAEEILQESFLKVWLHREKLPEITQLQAWMYKITARECLLWLRKQNSRQRQLTRVGEEAGNRTIAGPEEIAGRRELEVAIRTAITQLSPIRRRIYFLNREEGLKPAAIAERLQMPVGTVKNHLSIAIKLIREYLVKAGYPLLTVVLMLFL